MKAFFETIERLKNLKEFSALTISEVVGEALLVEDTRNPYFRSYFAEIDTGPFVRARFQEPDQGATVLDYRLNLVIRPNVGVIQENVAKHYGPGSIFQIIPEAAPEGRITYLYEYPAQKVFFQYTARTRRLLEVTICRGICR